jgi:glycosyltransferase involved in cell wall biosynthesis
MRKMRVLMVTPGYYPIRGGTETVVRNLSIELSKIGVDIDIMTFNMDQKWHPKWKGKMEKLDGPNRR